MDYLKNFLDDDTLSIIKKDVDGIEKVEENRMKVINRLNFHFNTMECEFPYVNRIKKIALIQINILFICFLVIAEYFSCLH